MFEDPQERVAWIRPPALGGWEYLIAHQSRHLWTVHHETYTICASPTFGHAWKYRGREHALPDRGSMLMEPGELHRTLSVPPITIFEVAIIPPDHVAAAAGDLGLAGAPHLKIAQTPDPALTRAVWRLGAAAEQGDRAPLELETLQAGIVARLLAHAERAPRLKGGANEPRAVARAKSYLRDNLGERVTLDELAAAAGLSRFRLVHAFVAAVGLPPHAYQLQLRIERARQLLQDGLPAAQAAVDLGFVDQAHFIRHFKKIMRVTPGQYARSAFARTVRAASAHAG
jgi:AraC-like DNA-binding protein